VEEEEEEQELRQLDGSTFQPFFTLIEDTLTHAHHHPTIHYLFADDDTDIVTEAACRSLTQDDPFMTTGHVAQSQQSQEHEPEQEPSRLPAPSSAVQEHYLLLDLQPVKSDSAMTSYEVTRAHSLSADWQITNTGISSAPSIDAVDEGAEGSEALMLRIEGRGIVRSDDDEDGNGKRKGSTEKETLEEMLRRFGTGLGDIRRAIEAGGSLGGEQDEVGD
jgi:hypothetical protein